MARHDATMALRRRMRRFARSEDGALVAFSLFVFLIMLMAAGLAVDTMRHERERVRLQATLDRAVLAAADLHQTLTPEEVVADYFARAGLDQALGQISVEDGLNARIVTAAATTEMPTLLMGLVGVDSLRAATTARAEERVWDIEISLVLDMSGSMEDHDRLTNLRIAASDFVETVMPEAAQQGDRGVTSISLVPYSTSVNIGPRLMDVYNVKYNLPDPDDSYSSCVLFDDDDYNSLALPTTWPLKQYEHFDPFDGGYSQRWPRRIAEPRCPRRAESLAEEINLMIPHSTDPVELTRAIGALRAGGSTEMDAGMRWGIAMLDPGTRPVIGTLVDDGTVSRTASGRPLAYQPEDVLKLAVLMTDGEPQAPSDLNPKLKEGLSNVWYDPDTNRYSVLLRGSHLRGFPWSEVDDEDDEDDCRDEYWDDGNGRRTNDGVIRLAPGNQDDWCVPRWYWVSRSAGAGKKYHDHPDWRNADGSDQRDSRHSWPSQARLQRLTYRELFDHVTLPDLRYFFNEPRGDGYFSRAERNILFDPWGRLGDADGTVDRLVRLCRAAKVDHKVTIYTIGFELDRIKGDRDESAATKQARARELMHNCASTEKHFIDVHDKEGLYQAFRTIAQQVERLRLTR